MEGVLSCPIVGIAVLLGKIKSRSKDLTGSLRCDLELRSPNESHQLTGRRKVSEREQMFAAGLSNLCGEGTPIIPVVAWLQIGLSFENS
jgi:hypothetical protein